MVKICWLENIILVICYINIDIKLWIKWLIWMVSGVIMKLSNTVKFDSVDIYDGYIYIDIVLVVKAEMSNKLCISIMCNK